VSSPAPLIEIFGSVQGEGRHVGAPMAFVRVAVCPIRCLYCDTPESYDAPDAAVVRGPDGEQLEPNPVLATRAGELVSQLGLRRVSVTGGEPLLYPDFVAELGHELRVRGRALHLETAALHPNAMRAALVAVDHVSADYKLPGTLERGDVRDQNLACLELAAASDVTVDAKIVVTPAVTRDDIADALEHLSDLRAHVTLILQPVTPFGAVTAAPSSDELSEFAAMAEARSFEVRVVPQLHKALGLP